MIKSMGMIKHCDGAIALASLLEGEFLSAATVSELPLADQQFHRYVIPVRSDERKRAVIRIVLGRGNEGFADDVLELMKTPQGPQVYEVGSPYCRQRVIRYQYETSNSELLRSLRCWSKPNDFYKGEKG